MFLVSHKWHLLTTKHYVSETPFYMQNAPVGMNAVKPSGPLDDIETQDQEVQASILSFNNITT